MARKIAIFWPGDYRAKPNELALPGATEASRQLEAALRKLGCESYRVEGWLTRPHEAIDRLGRIDDPLIGVCTHWFYGPHTTDGVVGKDNPLLLASNFSGQWPGLVGLLNTGACLESVGRDFSRIWTAAADWSADERFMALLDEWVRTGWIEYLSEPIRSLPRMAAAGATAPRPQNGADAIARQDRPLAGPTPARQVYDGIRQRRILALMLGDTSMGMINGYFGPRLLNPIGFTEHKIDQAWIIHRGQGVAESRIDAALDFVKQNGVAFHYRERDAADFDENATREQLRDYLAVLDMIREFKADCLGWQYQLGLLPLRPPSDFAEGLFNSACRPESTGEPFMTATEGDQGALVPMELMKRLLKAKGLHPAVMFHDVRWGGEHDGRFVWVLLNSGSCGAYAFNHDPETLRGAHSYRQPAGYFPVPGGTFAGESLPGKITWARAWIHTERQTAPSSRCTAELCMDIGRGEVVKLPEQKRDAWWEGTTRQWPFMAADLGVSQECVMAHYMSNHICVAYGDIRDELAALCQSLGVAVRLWGGE